MKLTFLKCTTQPTPVAFGAFRSKAVRAAPPRASRSPSPSPAASAPPASSEPPALGRARNRRQAAGVTFRGRLRHSRRVGAVCAVPMATRAPLAAECCSGWPRVCGGRGWFLPSGDCEFGRARVPTPVLCSFGPLPEGELQGPVANLWSACRAPRRRVTRPLTPQRGADVCTPPPTVFFCILLFFNCSLLSGCEVACYQFFHCS